MLIKFEDKHSAVFGTTQEGKTYAVTKSLAGASKAVLFFDMKQEPVKGYVHATSDDDAGLIVELLKAGQKINYTPSRGTRYAEVAALIELVMHDPIDVYIICDECHLAYTNADRQKRAAQAAYEELATTGLSRGHKGIFISQRPALMPNTLMHLADYQIYFRTDAQEYLSKYLGQAQAADLQQRLDAGGQHSYVLRYRGELSGAYKV